MSSAVLELLKKNEATKKTVDQFNAPPYFSETADDKCKNRAFLVHELALIFE